LSPRELAESLRQDARSWEWLGIDPSLLDQPAASPPLAAAPVPVAPKLLRVEKVPRDWKSLRQTPALDLAPKLPPADLEGLATLTALEHLVVRLPAGAALPETLVNLRSLAQWFGAVPSLPMLRELVAWSPTSLPKSLPALVSLSLQVDEAELPDPLAAASGYPALKVLVIHNVWPKKPKLPSAFSKLKKLEGLEFVRLSNTGYSKDVSGLAAQRKALGCEVSAD